MLVASSASDGKLTLGLVRSLMKRLGQVKRNSSRVFFLKNIYLLTYLFIYLILAALGLCGCVRAFSSCSEQGLLFRWGAWAY